VVPPDNLPHTSSVFADGYYSRGGNVLNLQFKCGKDDDEEKEEDFFCNSISVFLL